MTNSNHHVISNHKQNRIMKHIFYSLLFLFVANISVAQTAKLKRANKYYNNLAFESAASLYSGLAEQNLLDDTDMHKLADAYYKMGDLKSAEPWFGKLYEKNIASNE